jgi:hypothetical protein
MLQAQTEQEHPIDKANIPNRTGAHDKEFYTKLT